MSDSETNHAIKTLAIKAIENMKFNDAETYIDRDSPLGRLITETKRGGTPNDKSIVDALAYTVCGIARCAFNIAIASRFNAGDPDPKQLNLFADGSGDNT